jgi:putative flippase GtrA
MEKTLKKFFVFCLVGAIATIIDLVIFNLSFRFSPFVIARIIGIITSMGWNFSANRNFTFKSNGNIPRQLIKYLLVYGLAMSANVLTGWIVFSFLGPGTLNANIAAASGLIVSIPLAFFGSLLWTFKIEKHKTSKNVDII